MFIRLNAKKILLGIIALQLLALPVLLFASKQKQEIRSRAEEISQTAQEQVAPEDSGNAPLSAELHSSFDPMPNDIEEFTSAPQQVSLANPQNPALKKQVYTYLPYWQVEDDTDTYLQYKYITHLIYHGVSLKSNGVINKTNGPYNVWRGETMSTIVRNARAEGVKVIPNIVLFNTSRRSALSEFLDSEPARRKAVNQIINLLKSGPERADGVAIDFEFPSSSRRAKFVAFIRDLRSKMKAENPDWDLIVAVDSASYVSASGFDLEALQTSVDGFFIMSYHLKNPSRAENAGSTNPRGSLAKLADKYLEKIPGEKIILGFPLYLTEWKTLDNSLRAPKKPGTGGGKTVSENECGLSGTTCTRLAKRYAATYGRQYDPRDGASYYSFYVCTGSKKNKGWHQVYFDDEEAFSDKFAMVNRKGLGGVGFWAHNYDKGFLDTWNAIYNKFADKTKVSAPSKKPGFRNPPPVEDNGCRPNQTPSPTPTPISGTALRITLGLDGIGKTGKIPKGGTKKPKNKTRNIEVRIFSASDNSLSYSGNQEFSFNENPSILKFQTTLVLPETFREGVYNLYFSAAPYLTARYPNSITITKDRTADVYLKSFSLITGDINRTPHSANRINILDYNILISCSKYKDEADCPSAKYKNLSDLTDDGVVNENDFTLWLEEVANQPGEMLPN